MAKHGSYPVSRWYPVTLFLVLLFALAFSAAGSEWRASEVRIVLSLGLDGSMLVRETFTISSESTHDVPWRDLPLRHIGSQEHEVDIEILQLTHAKQALSFDAEVVEGALRVHFGPANRRIPPGQRIYELLYHVDAHLALDGGREWLGWRPLGAGFAAVVDDLEVTLTFPRPIEHAQIRVHPTSLPPPVPMDTQVAADGTVTLTWNNALGAGFGPAILVSWPRGHLRIATDSEIEPWFSPRATVLFLAFAALLPLGALAWMAGRWHSPVRRALPLASITVSLTSLYASGIMASRYPEWFPWQFLFALATVVFVIALRHWLTRRRLRIVYLLTTLLLIGAVTYLLVNNVSPWFVVLLIVHTDFVILAWWQSRRVAQGSRGYRKPDTDSTPRARREMPQAVRKTPRTPFLERGDSLDQTRHPDGRRTPYFAGPDGEGTGPDTDPGLSLPPDDGRSRKGVSERRPGRARKY
jgi:hypothetical protein